MKRPGRKCRHWDRYVPGHPSGDRSGAFGLDKNQADGDWSFVGGGVGYNSSGDQACIGGGTANLALAANSFVAWGNPGLPNGNRVRTVLSQVYDSGGGRGLIECVDGHLNRVVDIGRLLRVEHALH